MISLLRRPALAAAVLSIALLGACGNNDDNNTPGNNTTATNNTTGGTNNGIRVCGSVRSSTVGWGGEPDRGAGVDLCG